MRHILPCLTLLLCFFSCEEPKPELTIPEERLIPLMADIHLADMATLNIPQTVKDSIQEAYLNQIFRIHDIDRAVFDSNMQILYADPARYQEISVKVAEQTKKDKNDFNTKKNDASTTK